MKGIVPVSILSGHLNCPAAVRKMKVNRKDSGEESCNKNRQKVNSGDAYTRP